MGSMDDCPRKPIHLQSSKKSKLKILLLLVFTSLLSIYIFSASSFSIDWTAHTPRIHLWDSEALLRELNSTQSKLSISQAQVTELHRRLATSNALLETLIAKLGRPDRTDARQDGLDGWLNKLTGELKLAAGPHKLPLGQSANIRSDELYPTLGTACRHFQDELVQYMSYDVGGECPSDDNFAQRLLLKGCEPLPRRRCHPKSPVGYVEPTPFPTSLWTIPPDTSVIWDPYTCKNYTCLVHRRHERGNFDCKDCFALDGREKGRWLRSSGELDYAIDEVLGTKSPGTIRIGLDIGGGTGTFAARMRERNVTIVTSSMNFDGPCWN